MVDSGREAIARGYRKFIVEHPERILRKQVVVNGIIVEQSIVNWPSFPGVAVGVSELDANVSYFRRNSFGACERAEKVLAAEVTPRTLPRDPAKVIGIPFDAEFPGILLSVYFVYLCGSKNYYHHFLSRTRSSFFL